MAERKIVTLPYGEGLERSKGVMVVQPTSFEDLRNVFLFDGKAQVRAGLALRSVLQDDVPSDLDVTVMLAPFRSQSASIGVGFDSVSKEVWLNRLDIDGTNPAVIGSLGTLDAGITFDPPIIIGADSDNKFFLAHDEPNPTSRLVTQVYDPSAFPNLAPLQADLDGINGQQDVFFRGVVRHLSYIFGWGYGSFSDPVRGDVVRVSNSGDSKIFEDFAFFEAGQQGETVMVCRSAGPSLMVYKETETYEIFGYSPDTFGIRLADSLFGCVGSRLAVSVSGSVFFWSTQGPRVTSGGPSVDIAVPLDIDGPDPATLVAESDPENAFAEYDPRTRVIQFVWGQRVYALSIRDPNRPRWSYYELGETAQCSGLFFLTQSTAGGGGPPIGHVDELIVDAPAQANMIIGASPTGGIVPIPGETVTIDGKVYTWTSPLGAADGDVLIAANTQLCANNLFFAITLGAGAGVDYAAATTLHPTVGQRTLARAAPPGVIVRADVDGTAGNGIPLSTTMVQDPTAGAFKAGNAPQYKNYPLIPVTVLQDGQDIEPTVISVQWENIDQIGAEDVEIHLSTDGGVNYKFSGIVPANTQQFQEHDITIEDVTASPSKAIQPLTDYKLSLRYRLGGQFAPGFGDVNPDVWQAVSDPLASGQAETETPAAAIVLESRLGTNWGVWERKSEDVNRWRVVPETLPAGHEEMDIEWFLEVVTRDTDPDQFSGATRGTVVSADALLSTIDKDSFGYPQFLQEFPELSTRPAGGFFQGVNNFTARFSNGAKKGPFSNVAEVYGGPDMPLRNTLRDLRVVKNFVALGVTAFEVRWSNTGATPPFVRLCPPGANPNAPANHRTEIWIRNHTQGGSWLFVDDVDPFVTFFQDSFNIGFLTVNSGDEIRVAVRHRVNCFNPGFPSFGQYTSEWSQRDAEPNYISDLAFFGSL